MGKGEIAHNEQFLLFPRCFLLNPIPTSLFVHIFDIRSSFAAEFEEPKIGITSKGLTNLKKNIFENIEELEAQEGLCGSTGLNYKSLPAPKW